MFRLSFYLFLCCAAVNLLERMLDLDPDTRITAEEALCHEYLRQYADPSDEPISQPYDQSFEEKDFEVPYWKSMTTVIVMVAINWTDIFNVQYVISYLIQVLELELIFLCICFLTFCDQLKSVFLCVKRINYVQQLYNYVVDIILCCYCNCFQHKLCIVL